MEPQVLHTPFDEVLSQDINLLGKNSALAGDRALASILRVPPNTGAVNFRGIIPRPMAGAAQFITPIVGGIRIAPFDVVLQSRTQATSDSLESVKDIRVATCVDLSDGYTDLTAAKFPSANGTARHVLVYATISVDQNEEQATIQHRDPSTGSVESISRVTRCNTTVSIQTVLPSGSGRPILPTDNGNSFFIPLCIVCLPATWTAGSTPAANQIWELAPMVPLDGGVGATTVRPANSQWGDSGHLYPQGSGTAVAAAVDIRRPWDASASPPRPPAFLPPTMTGGEQRVIALDIYSGSHQDGDIIDDSVDWRKRIFMVVSQAREYPFAWNASHQWLTPSPLAAANVVISQSFAVETDNFNICDVDPDSDKSVTLFVDSSTGALKLRLAGSPGKRYFVWLIASGQFSNA